MAVQTAYGFGKKVPLAYEDAVRRVTELLKAEGFGVLTEIDVQKTMKEKLGADFRRYVILGACNPHLAHRAFAVELQIGLLLPCNVVVYEADGGTAVAILDPLAMMGITGNPALRPVAEEARAKLERVLSGLAG